VYIHAAGDAAFQSENLVGLEAGYRRLLGSTLYLDVAAFHNTYSDLAGYGAGSVSLQTSPIVHGLLSVPYSNTIGGTTDGFEVSPEWRPASWLQLKGAYAFLASDMSADPAVGDASDEQVARYEGSSPRHQGFVSASLQLPARLELDHTYRFMSRLPSRDIPRYVTADARLAWPLSRSLTLAVAGQNLLQPHHAEFFPDDRPLVGIRRSVYASLTWRR
jgi:iron complex outermembrane receptor protein